MDNPVISRLHLHNPLMMPIPEKLYFQIRWQSLKTIKQDYQITIIAQQLNKITTPTFEILVCKININITSFTIKIKSIAIIQLQSNHFNYSMNEQQLQEVYQMVDSITFSRNKRNINRDFADGLMMAELIHHYNPKIVSLHNYPTTNAVSKKIENWKTLNNKVLKKIGISLSKEDIQNIANAVPNAIQVLLYQILVKFEKPDEEGRLTQQARRFQKSQPVNRVSNKIQPNVEEQASMLFGANEVRGKAVDELDIDFKKDKYFENSSKQVQVNNQQVQELIDKIEQSYLQLSKLNELNKAKEEMLLNLQKKLEKVLFN